MALRRTLAALLTGGALVFATPALGAPAADLARDPALWATVNICDTVGHPDGVGLRGSMPGSDDRRDALFMRLRLQFQRGDGTCQAVGPAGDSGWMALGRGDARVRQAGRTFTVMPPPDGHPAYVMRGVAAFEWRRNGDVVRRARRATSAGHPGTPGADPAGFSDATCSVR